MRLGLKDRLKLAFSQDRSIVVPRAEAVEHAGFTEEYLVSLGLNRADLKKLERKRCALRGYDKIKTGWRTKWILVVADTEVPTDGRKNEPEQRQES